MRRAIFPLLYIFMACCSLISCGDEAQRKTVRTANTEVFLTDDLGNEVHLADSPRRVMALASSLTEVLAAVADPAQIVGVTQTDDYPEWVTDRPVVNSYPLDLERLIALNPELVFTMEGMTGADDLKRMTELGIPVYVQQYRTVQDVLDGIGDVGRLTGNGVRTMALTDSLQRWHDRLEVRGASKRPPSVLVVTWTDPIYVHGHNTLTTDKLRLAGARNALDTVMGAQYPALSREHVLQLDPDVIFGGSFEKMDSTFFDIYPELRRLKAYRDRRIYATDDNLTTRPGPRVLESVEEYRKLIHGKK